jgi:hypothetical protein
VQEGGGGLQYNCNPPRGVKKGRRETISGEKGGGGLDCEVQAGGDYDRCCVCVCVQERLLDSFCGAGVRRRGPVQINS